MFRTRKVLSLHLTLNRTPDSCICKSNRFLLKLKDNERFLTYCHTPISNNPILRGIKINFNLKSIDSPLGSLYVSHYLKS